MNYSKHVGQRSQAEMKQLPALIFEVAQRTVGGRLVICCRLFTFNVLFKAVYSS